MCRHLAYLGPPAPLSRWLFDAPHALVHQAAAPRDMRGGGTVNADGFGAGWFPDTGSGQAGAPPRCYRRDRPMWADSPLPALAAAIEAPAVLAAVRSATPGMALGESACAPFAADDAMFSLNGRVAGWPDSMTELAAQLPVRELLTMAAPTDSALLWALVRQRMSAGEPAAEAVARVATQVAAAAPGSRLNLLLVAPDALVATAVTHSLWVRQAPDSVLVSSEPLDDDPEWSEVPDGSLVVASATKVEISPLGTEREGTDDGEAR